MLICETFMRACFLHCPELIDDRFKWAIRLVLQIYPLFFLQISKKEIRCNVILSFIFFQFASYLSFGIVKPFLLWLNKIFEVKNQSQTGY